jgi:hypothetical protein
MLLCTPLCAPYALCTRAGTYTTGPSPATMNSTAPCLAGSYCTEGLSHLCPAGRFGCADRMSDPLCNAGVQGSRRSYRLCWPSAGAVSGVNQHTGRPRSLSLSFPRAADCSPGFYCPAGSFFSRTYACGGSASNPLAATFYCPQGSAAPLNVSEGNYSIGSSDEVRGSLAEGCGGVASLIELFSESSCGSLDQRSMLSVSGSLFEPEATAGSPLYAWWCDPQSCAGPTPAHRPAALPHGQLLHPGPVVSVPRWAVRVGAPLGVARLQRRVPGWVRVSGGVRAARRPALPWGLLLPRRSEASA